jgi:hypothetical protein
MNMEYERSFIGDNDVQDFTGSQIVWFPGVNTLPLQMYVIM